MKTNKVQIEHKLPSECTTIIIGQEQTADGSMIVARSEDWDAMEAKNYEIFEDTDNGPREFVAKDSPFRCELPEKALGYSALSPYNLHGHWGSAGFNTAGVGMSATESIFSSDEVLKHDPLVENGVAENSVFNITLPYVHTAREGVERLGMLIEKYGIAEGFGIGFVDSKEIWYLETACGHRWLACRMPKDQYFVTGNQSRFRTYDPNDKENYLASADLIEFAEKHGLYNPAQGAFDFHEAYARDIKLDTTYNYPRVWGLQQFFSPEIKNDVTKNTFPVNFARHSASTTTIRSTTHISIVIQRNLTVLSLSSVPHRPTSCRYAQSYHRLSVVSTMLLWEWQTSVCSSHSIRVLLPIQRLTQRVMVSQVMTQLIGSSVR